MSTTPLAESPAPDATSPCVSKPVLSLQTVYFDDTDKADAQRLGTDLYDKLTRPVKDPLAYGPGIPVLVGVQAKQVDPKLAETTILVPVLGNTSFGRRKDEILQALDEWSQAGAHAFAVPTSPNWQIVQGRMAGSLLSPLYGTEALRRHTLDELILETSRIWGNKDENKARLFISHAKADPGDTDETAREIGTYVRNDDNASAFFEVTGLHPRKPIDRQPDDAVAHGVFVAVRGDAFSSRAWCQKELLLAKMRGLPTLSVEVLKRGEARSSPYAGNGPSLVWKEAEGAAPIVSQAFVEWLRSEFFHREAKRIIAAANLPDDAAVVARPPELLDFAQGPLLGEQAQLVLHPDPELSAIERRVLKSARPRLHLATPSTAFRRLLSRGDETADVSSPLEGMQVAMSLSRSPEEGGPGGLTEMHSQDATIHVARTLISAGAAIAYGGDFRGGGYTELLGQLIQTYNQTASKEAQHLHHYAAAHLKREEEPDDIPLVSHHLAEEEPQGLASQSLLKPPPADHSDDTPIGLYFSDMRRVMELHVDARFLLGGKVRPQLKEDESKEPDGKGYLGRYPGIVEEALHALRAKHPLYVAGGFGGAAAWVATLMEEQVVPTGLQDDFWMKHEFFKKNAAMIDTHPSREGMNLPARMEDLASEILALSASNLKSDEQSLAWNGLSVVENKELFRTRDPVAIAALVTKGLMRFTKTQDKGKLQIELVRDSVTAADKLDVIVVAAMDGVPLGGAGAALDRLTGGSATEAFKKTKEVEGAEVRKKTDELVSLNESLIDADWLYVASLGKLDEPAAILREIRRVAEDAAAKALRYGFQRMGIVTFGGSIMVDLKEVANEMIEGLASLGDSCAVIWYENDPERFDELVAALKEPEEEAAGEDTRGKETTGNKPPKAEKPESNVKLTTRIPASPVVTGGASLQNPLYLTVELEANEMKAIFLPPLSSVLVGKLSCILNEETLRELSSGSLGGRETPNLDTLKQRGADLGKRLFGKEAAKIFSKFADARLVVAHDTAASQVPFEMLLAQPEGKSADGDLLRPALNGGVTRLLSVKDLDLLSQFPKPPKRGKLKVLLVVNPTKDPRLDGAEKEAESVRKTLKFHEKNLVLQVLKGDEATVQNFTAELETADILHYCGHAFFDGPELGQSGLILAKEIEFTGVDLKKLSSLPRMAFVNACEAGRVRAKKKAATFAELFLRSGIDAYLGTFWEVKDEAATLFAETVYTELAKGMTLEQAVLAGRRILFQQKHKDWANYMLFGGGDFRLVAK